MTFLTTRTLQSAPSHLLTLGILILISFSSAQTLPDGINQSPYACPARPQTNQNPSAADIEQQERYQRYSAILPAFFVANPPTPYETILMPVEGVRVENVADTWAGPRSGGRQHEGQDIFAPEGTPIYSGTPGYVYRIGKNNLGGNTIVIVGGGGWRYYYAHLSAYAPDLKEGQAVTTNTLIGYVGNTGNAISTPPHLHLGVYTGDQNTCEWDAINPLPYLQNR